MDLFENWGKRGVGLQKKVTAEPASYIFGLCTSFLALGILNGLVRDNHLGILFDLLHGCLELLPFGIAQVCQGFLVMTPLLARLISRGG